MAQENPIPNWSNFRSGALAGAVSALVFAVVHDLFISNIWFSTVAMMVAGALCGLCVGWSFSLLDSAPSIWGWIRYNLLYVGMFGVLGAVSVILFEPVTTIGELIAANGPPDALILQALPVTAAFTILTALGLTALYRWTWAKFGAVLLTTIVLVVLLGLNVSVIGLVDIPRSAFYLVMELFGLIVVLNVVFTGVFILLERKHLLHHTNP